MYRKSRCRNLNLNRLARWRNHSIPSIVFILSMFDSFDGGRGNSYLDNHRSLVTPKSVL